MRVVEGRVVQPNLQMGADPRQPVEHGHVVERGKLIGQDAYLHAAPRRLDQLVEHQLTDVILIPDIRLHVDRMTGGTNQAEPSYHRRLAVVEQADDMHGLLRRRCGDGIGRRIQQRRRRGAVVGSIAAGARVDGGCDDRIGATNLRFRHDTALQQKGRSEQSRKEDRARRHVPA
jgi:hypothetical protein